MSTENVVYKVRAGGAEYGADDEASANALAELLNGEVFSVSRKEALSHVRTITKVADYPPVLADMLATLKSTIVNEVTDNELLSGSCWRIILQYDSTRETWYDEIKNLASGPVVYNQTTGEKYPSICHARWEHSKSCAVKYLANGINDDKFGKVKPHAAVIAKAKADATAAAVKAAAEQTVKDLVADGMTQEEAEAKVAEVVAS